MVESERGTTVFTVLDVLDHPHGGTILRLRLQGGDAPTVRELRGALLRASSPDGEERTVRVEDFAALGGKPSDDRLARTGRADVHVHAADGRSEPSIGLRWTVTGPVAG